MAPLLRDHNNSKGQEPAFVQNHRRGQGRASARTVVTAAQYVKIPVHSLDKLVAEENGISPKALRLLGAVWELQPKNNDGGTRPPWCEVSAADLAKTAGVSPVTVPALRQELEEAGMVLVDVADGRAAVILPLARELDTEEREELTECLRGVLAERDGDRTPYRPRTGKPTTDEATTDDDETTPKNRDVNASTSGNDSGEPETRPVEFVERSSAEHRRNLVRGWKTGAAGGQHGATA
ncbi:helix-turn-helix domain-containing protein [Amycolatopsis keratiniphila]|uniref:Uncharacterized protein n=1 Tax=Amycolatopsis keratiniphila subsp. keratiniphila TaxID=227715 RepID=A0A1W2M204_9PSEU|nr:hypothetical protein [Amycolatopsis keratiniphila]ONF73935.1 hypothetical protein AVR91_0204180 [Amycolatopsis keratiniphila subsp. keratiniphila]